MSKYLFRLITLIFAVSPLTSGCSYFSEGLFIDEDRYAETSSGELFGDVANRIVYLDQNWDKQDSVWFYTTTQGSTLMPYAIFLNLEQADTKDLFRSAENMSRYRYLVQSPSFSNPDGLPVGFVKDEYKDKEYIGFTCSACHTTQINYKTTGIRIDGGPALADMEGMLIALERAMKVTLEDDAKFERLARNVLDGKFEQGKPAFRQRLQEIYQAQLFYNQSNAPRHGEQVVHYGYARLDAFGRIYNRILNHLTPDSSTNFNPANAPVSYPFLWDTPQSDFVQWNGVGDNRDKGLAGVLGPLGRNTGEVLGVFADFSLQRDGKKVGFQSSVNKLNLERLERHLQNLQSPVWPENILPEINRDLAQKGKEVYTEYRCGWCHDGGKSVITASAEFDRENKNRVMYAQFTTLPWIGTDEQMAENALHYKGKTGLFEGKEIELGKGERFGEESPVLPALTKAAQGVILAPDYDKWPIRRWMDQLFMFIRALADNQVPPTQRNNDFEVVDKSVEMLNTYKARTLNGIWATAPYLHNGSIANLYQLFLPACSDEEISQGKKCRFNQFTVGSREFDAINVGFAIKSKKQYPELFLYDTSMPSNSNRGHEYAAGITPIIKLDDSGNPVKTISGEFKSFRFPPISEEKRLALVEYLKTL